MDLVIFCDVVASLCLALADHLPVVLVIELPVPCTSAAPSKDFRSVDWEAFGDALKDRLLVLLAIPITTADQFYRTVSDFTSVIQAVIWDNNLIPTWKLCPHTKR